MTKQYDRWEWTLKERDQQIQKLWTFIEKYADHQRGCRARTHMGADCSCGYRKKRDKLEA